MLPRIDTGRSPRHATRAMTLAYASPEQIEGAPLGTATDVWSLGVVLYELVAGAHPFRHITTDHARANAILSSAIAPPSQYGPRGATRARESGEVSPTARARRIPADIDAIVMKALRREPAQRYASAREFAQDVERFLSARPVQARRGQWTYRAQRFVQRNRWPLAAGALLAAVVAVFTWRTVLAEREARVQAEVADRTTEFLISAFSLSDPTQAERHDFSARDVLDRGRDRVNEELADQPRVRARLLEALGNAYGGINEGDLGAPLLEEAAQLNLDPAVNDPLAAARSLRAKVRSIRAVSGSTDEAEDAARRAFDLVRRHGDGDALLLADAYETLAQATYLLSAARQALALCEAGQADAEARGLLEGVIADRSTAHEGAVDLAYARLPLARWHLLHGDPAEANTLLDQVESVGTGVEPDLRARAAATRADIARARGDEASALEHDRSAYEITRSDQGALNPRTARCALVYTRALRGVGDPRTARALEREYRPCLEAAYPPTSAFRRSLAER
jgi:serine/threonine-protein kinase